MGGARGSPPRRADEGGRVSPPVALGGRRNGRGPRRGAGIPAEKRRDGGRSVYFSARRGRQLPQRASWPGLGGSPPAGGPLPRVHLSPPVPVVGRRPGAGPAEAARP